MVLYTDKKTCCGCGACAAACNRNAIRLVPDGDGFYYPQIDESLCVACGRCQRVCAFNNLKGATRSKQQYLARHRDSRTVLGSTSGGMYSALSEVVLKKGGVVYGADLCPDMTVRHVCIQNAAQRDHARGSKYVQSDMSDVYDSLQTNLAKGRDVIFFGTPCQVEAVLSATPMSLRERLYTVDLVCNGVGSPMVWQQHVDRLQKKFGKTMTYYWFRPKTQGYLTTSEVCQFQDGTRQEFHYALNKFNSLYYSGVIHRPSCTACRYAAQERVGDITIGDFSHARTKFPEFDASEGASMVLCNTEKGETLLDCARSALELLAVSREDCAQLRLHSCAQKNPGSEWFLQCCRDEGLEEAVKQWYGLWKRIKLRLMALVRGVKQ